MATFQLLSGRHYDGKDTFVAGQNDIVTSKKNMAALFPNKFKQVPDGTKPTKAVAAVDIEDDGVGKKNTTPSSKKKTENKKESGSKSKNPLGVNVTSKFISDADSTLKVYKKDGKYTVIDSSMEGDDAVMSDEPLDVKGVRSLLSDLVEA